MKKTIFILFTLFLFTSCSNKELDRDLAFDLIEEYFEYPNVEIINFNGITSSKKLNEDFYDLRANELIESKQKGQYGDEFHVIITQKGLPYYYSGKSGYNGYIIASNLIELNEITGIRFNEGGNIAYVDYQTARKDITPFGKTADFKEGDTKDNSVTMQLYDDGWRITTKENKKYVKSDFPLLYGKEEFKEFFASFDKAIKSKDKEYLNEIIEFPLIEYSFGNTSKTSKTDFWSNENIFKLNFEEEQYFGATETAYEHFKIRLDKGNLIFAKNGNGNISDETNLTFTFYFKTNKDGVKIFAYRSEMGMAEVGNDISYDNEGLSYVYVNVDNLRVRKTPTLDGETIENLKIGESVGFHNEKSSSKTIVKIRGQEIEDYWYKIKTPNGNIGWIHGCCFDYD